MRRCHDCGKLTANYRCEDCWKKIEEKGYLSRSEVLDWEDYYAYQGELRLEDYENIRSLIGSLNL